MKPETAGPTETIDTAVLRRLLNQPWMLLSAGVKVAALPRKPSGIA
jgi:hypothetical protein